MPKVITHLGQVAEQKMELMYDSAEVEKSLQH